MLTAFCHATRKCSFKSGPARPQLNLLCTLMRNASTGSEGGKLYRKIDPKQSNTSAGGGYKKGRTQGAHSPNSPAKPYKYVAPSSAADGTAALATTASADPTKPKLWKKVSAEEIERAKAAAAEKAHPQPPRTSTPRERSAKFGGKVSKRGNSYTRLFKADKMSEFIASAYDKRQVEPLLEAYSYADKNGLRLTLEEYTAVLWACSKVASPEDAGDDNPARRNSAYSYINNGGRALEALDIYNYLKGAEPSLPTEVFHFVMAVCAQFGSASTAATVLSDYRVMKFPPSPQLLADYVIAVAKFARRNGSTGGLRAGSSSGGGAEMERALYDVYLEYLDVVRPQEQDVEATADVDVDVEAEAEMGTVGTEEVFTQVARTFSRLGREEQVIEILKHYVNAGFEPSFDFCAEIFENALLEGDAKTLVVLSNWFLVNFEDAILPEGCIEKMLQIGCGGGNSILAGNSIELLRKCGYPVTGRHYAAWVAASTAGMDLPSILDALVEASNSGVDLYGAEGVDGFLLQDNISIYLSSSLRNTDDLYYELVELVRRDQAAPAMAVNAVIAAAGMNSQLDRAFATMQECTELFNLPATVHTYNALLCAVARSPDGCFMKTMLSLLERMEADGVAPNAMSYSFLTDAMIELAHYQHLDDILAHLMSGSAASSDNAAAAAREAAAAGVVLPPQKALRRLVIGLAAHPKYADKVEQVLPLIERDSEGSLPAFLQRRLTFLAQQRELASEGDGGDSDRDRDRDGESEGGAVGSKDHRLGAYNTAH